VPPKEGEAPADLKINLLKALHSCLQNHIPIVVAKVREDLVTTYKQAATINVEAFEGVVIDEESLVAAKNAEDVHCSAAIFAEKLFTQRNLYGTIKAICKVFGSIELLESYGNYMRLRVSR